VSVAFGFLLGLSSVTRYYLRSIMMGLRRRNISERGGSDGGSRPVRCLMDSGMNQQHTSLFGFDRVI